MAKVKTVNRKTSVSRALVRSAVTGAFLKKAATKGLASKKATNSKKAA